MKTRDVNDVCIVELEEDSISAANLIKLKKIFFEKARKKRVGLNLGNIKTVRYDFLDFLRDVAALQKLSLFNLNNDVYLMLFISEYDRYVDMYLDERDFLEDKRSIVHRRLKLLKSA